MASSVLCALLGVLDLGITLFCLNVAGRMIVELWAFNLCLGEEGQCEDNSV